MTKTSKVTDVFLKTVWIAPAVYMFSLYKLTQDYLLVLLDLTLTRSMAKTLDTCHYSKGLLQSYSVLKV